jgi:hypothetical protein
MRYQAHIYAYDLMDKVVVTVSMYTMPGRRHQPPQRVYLKHVQFPGTGESDELEWIKDALIGALEEL